MTARRVLHLLGTARPEASGIARVVGLLSKGLDPQRYETHAWFLDGDGPLRGEIESTGVRVRVFEWPGGSRQPLRAARFWNAIAGERFDLVHQHYGARMPRWITRRRTGARVVVHFWGHVRESEDLSPIRLEAPGADAVIACSEAVAARVVGHRAVVVYPAVPIPSAGRKVSPGGPTIGAAGRLVPMKGFVHLIRAMARVRERHPGARLEIAGSGPLHDELMREVRTLRLEDSVALLGWRSDLAPLLERWDVYAQPSVVEPFGIAALEAMAAGLPVVATTGSGLQEFVEHGRSGWLVPPADSEELSERLTSLLADPEMRAAMGEAGRSRARDRFSPEKMVSSIRSVYENVLSGEEAPVDVPLAGDPARARR